MQCRGETVDFLFFLESQADYREYLVIMKFSLASGLWHGAYTTFD